MSAIRDKLRLLGLMNAPLPVASLRGSFDFRSVMAGEYRSTPAGNIFCVEEFHPVGERIGNAELSFPENADPLFDYAGIRAANDWDPEDWLFIDTETTGLAGGTGTIAFLVGVGRFRGGMFRLRQYLMADPAEEPALIAALKEEFAGARGLVSYNGRVFDLPLLDTRAILNEHERFSPQVGHLDLLPIARRLWRNRFENCTLACLEYRVLDILREGNDIAGALIPALYFEFLRSGDGAFFPDVAYHNRIDILAMTALFKAAADGFFNGRHDPDTVGSFYLRIGREDQALDWLQRSPTPGMTLATIYRRMQRHDEAAVIWQSLADRGDWRACVELSKYFEHRVADPQLALQWAQRARKLMDSRPSRPLTDLEHRLHRLQGLVSEEMKRSATTPIQI